MGTLALALAELAGAVQACGVERPDQGVIALVSVESNYALYLALDEDALAQHVFESERLEGDVDVDEKVAGLVAKAGRQLDSCERALLAGGREMLEAFREKQP